MAEPAGCLTFRPSTRDDEPFLWEMLYQAIFVPHGMPLPDRDIVKHSNLARYVEGWGRIDDMGVAAVDAGIPVGAAWLRLMIGYGYVDDQTPELSVAVLPEYRGQGLGTQMIERLLQVAKSRYHAVSLSVSVDNPARRLYERLGFKAVSRDDASMTMRIDLDQ
ncbi:MAG: GNAT family N-acetyltransferase [Anaerolineae bacterium]|nr:GNAT family N-acetyltransferase [Anaerolineae bacterium]